MTQPITPSPKRSWHWFILQSDDTDFGIGKLLDGVLRDATGAAIYEIVPVNAEAQPPAATPVIPPPPAHLPLWNGVVLMDLTIRDESGASVGVLKNGAPVSVYAEGMTFGGYTDRVVISQPLEESRNVWREGIKKI